MDNKKVFDVVLGNGFEMCLAFDGKGKILFANEMAMDELGFTDVSKVSLFDFFRDDRDRHFDYTEQHGSHDEERMVYRKNLTCFKAKVRFISTEIPEYPYLAYILSLSREATLEKLANKAEIESNELNKTRTEFVANVTHELRTPVNGILGNTRILLEEETDEKKLQTLHTIETACNVMHSLINNILDFSKLESGKFTLENREFEFKNLIDFVKCNHEPKITEKGLTFFVNISPEIPDKIIGDELRIGQILNNLLSNATKFTTVGKITLQALMTNRIGNRIELFFMVIDTGIGIDKADMEKLFKSFSQVDASISRQFGGTGLGLNISKQLANMMGGDITVESEKGKGSMFSFSIWVELPEDEAGNSYVTSAAPTSESMHNMLNDDPDTVNRMTFGKKENLQEINKALDKLILCLEMSNWEKAEGFAETIKELTADGPKELKTSVLRLKMSVQKADVDKAKTAYEAVREQMVGLNG